SSDKSSDVEGSNVEISVLENVKANSVIIRLLQAVPEVTNNWLLVYIGNLERTRSDGVDMKDEPFGSDIGSKNDFEVEAIKDHNRMSSEILNNTIKQLKEEIKSNKYSEVEKAHLYTMLSYLCLVKHNRQRVEASIIVAEAVRKGMYMDGHEHADVVAYCEKFLEKMKEYEMYMIIFSGKNKEEEIRPATHNIIILIAFPNLTPEAYIITYPGKDGDKW
ncbi:5660_t:CDS:2, partial [Racocetra fulgida]